ncbi:MAG: site-2 protease family protein [Acidobacteria bacterium]|nr:MAG: site-2 protease family protein [Acidobacteriota bacterium]
MFGRTVTLFKMFGFAVRVDASWLIIAVLITWSFSALVFPHAYPGLSTTEYWLMGIGGALLLFASIIVHELAHSLVARTSGLAMKGITLFIFGGVAEMDREPSSAKAEFQMAIAGPLTSVAVGIIFYFLSSAMRGVWPAAVTGVLTYLALINWVLAAFNMVPAFPLDGGRVLRSLLWHWKGNIWQATRIASSIGSGFGMVMMIYAIVPLLHGDMISAVWWFLIGMFLRGAAQGSYQQLVVQRMLEGEPIRRFMNTNPITVSPAISLEELVENFVYKYHYKMFPVVGASNELLGCITTKEVKDIPRSEWSRNSVQAVMRPYCAENTVTPDTDAVKALAKMRNSQNSRLMVVEGGHLVAVLTLKDLLNFLSTKLELESGSSGLPSNFRV